MEKTLKIDITEKVTARFKAEYLELYSHKFRIGRFYVDANNPRYDLEEGYIFENGRFYRLIHMRREIHPPAKGWC
ncbi:DUF2553 family protein [Microbacteriaceae bacterium 4G12]